MATHKTLALEGDLLDAAVMLAGVTHSASPSRDPAIAFALMQLHRIDVFHTRGGGVQASVGENDWTVEGRDELEAIMRCFVMHRLGDEIELPGPQ